MSIDNRAALAKIKSFTQLIAYLRDEMGWPIARDSFEVVEDLFYDFTADELGIDPKTAAKIESIKRLRPLSPRQPWGIFFIKFEPKKLPVVALRRILSQVALKKRASANRDERAAWAPDDLLFVSNYGEGEERKISFAHFSTAEDGHDLPTLKVLGWDNLDTALHLDGVAKELTEHLSWPEDDTDIETWRSRWRAAFTLRHRETITTSKELSIRLAELARAIRDRIKTAISIEVGGGPLTKLMKAFQEALVHDLDADGFADMYAQTIAYGLLSARIADPLRKTADDFAAHMRTNPFLRELMETFLKVGGRRGKAGGPGIDFDELGVSEVVDLLDDANMEAVVRDFGDRNPQEDPVIHFYELFLKEYDAKKRMQRGVFYTPRPVVSYIVRSVDELLRTEFGLADGLADTTSWGEMAKHHKDLKIPDGVSPDQGFVQILDPATGTGTFLVEVIDLIHKTLVAKWKAQGHGERKIDALWNEYVPKHLLTRLHGYELLMAPYAIAHLKIGLKLYETGYRFGSDERARVYLTNALEPAGTRQLVLDFLPALAHEATAVNNIKRLARFTVVIGNPPYSSLSQNMNDWARGIVDVYFHDDSGRMEERGNRNQLQDDYVKFFRLGQMAIESSGVGTLGFISNSSYTRGPWFRGMRYQLMCEFDHIAILDLHGSQAHTLDSKEGDQNVFEITTPVAIAVLWKSGSQPQRGSVVTYLEIQGSRDAKYARLAAMTASSETSHALTPGKLNQWRFVPHDDANQEEWARYKSIPDMFVNWGAGVLTNRNGLAVADSRPEVLCNARRFADLTVSDAELEAEFGFSSNYQWTTGKARKEFAKSPVADLAEPYTFRPFDFQFIYWHKNIVYNMRGDKMEVFREGPPPIALMFSRNTKHAVYTNIYVTNRIADRDCLEKSNVAPLYTSADSGSSLFSGHRTERHCNLAEPFILAFAGMLCVQRSALLPEEIFHYEYAVLHSPGYRSRYAEFLRIDFPRLPLTGNLELFRALARLGGELVALHLLESPKLAKTISDFIGGRNPEVEKVSWSKNTVWIDKAQTTGFKGVAEDVWNFHIGGYQVCEKWLKDRKGRKLSKDDIVHYQKIVVALSETIRIMKEIDEVIEKHGGWPGAFQASKPISEEQTDFYLKAAEPETKYKVKEDQGKR